MRINLDFDAPPNQVRTFPLVLLQIVLATIVYIGCSQSEQSSSKKKPLSTPMAKAKRHSTSKLKTQAITAPNADANNTPPAKIACGEKVACDHMATRYADAPSHLDGGDSTPTANNNTASRSSPPKTEPFPAGTVSPPKTDTIKLAFVGDIIFGRVKNNKFNPILKQGFDTLGIIKNDVFADLLVGNLETPVTQTITTQLKGDFRYKFVASKQMVTHLKTAGFDVLSFANNHHFDVGTSGYRQSPDIIRNLGMVPIGHVDPNRPAFRMETVYKNGWKIGFLAVTNHINGWPKKRPKFPYIQLKNTTKTLVPILKDARETFDLLIVFIHWGQEYAPKPDPYSIKVAKQLVDAGAHLVIGHHPHVLQGISAYKNGLIAYSLGNFLFENTGPIPRQTGILTVQFKKDQAKLHEAIFIPAVITRTPAIHPKLATGKTGEVIRHRLKRLSAKLGTHWIDKSHKNYLILDR